MAFIRRKPSADGQRVYLYEVETYRDKEGKVKQRQNYLGREIIDKKGKPKLKPKTSTATHVEEILPFGDLALLYSTAQTLDIPAIIDRFAPRSQGTPVGEALLALAINHLTGRIALADVSEWFERSMLRYWMNIRSDRISEKRLLGVLDQVCKQQDDVMRDKTWLISQALHDKIKELYGQPEQYAYYDRTQVVYVGENCDWAEFGYGLDMDKGRRKIGMGVVVFRGSGFPALYRVYRGNRADATTVGAVAQRIDDAEVEDVVLVMDRGMKSKISLESLQKRGIRSIIGVRSQERVFKRMVHAFEDDAVERSANRVWRGRRVICAVDAVIDGVKYVLYQDPKVRGEMKAGFMRKLSKREKELADLAAEVQKNPGRWKDVKRIEAKAKKTLRGMGKYIDVRLVGRKLEWQVDEAKVDAHLREVGRACIASTDLDLDSKEIVHVYLDKDEVEKVWRIGKGDLGLRGVKHFKRDRVVAYLFVCYLAYVLWAAVRWRLRAAGLDVSVDEALRILRRVELVRLVRGKNQTLEAPVPTGVERELCEKLGLMNLKQVNL